ncbi:MAG: hypothetical protein BWY76_00540 [bacterium ADurb.Bin429]|nr:MAG: hypothetical protein BWY76_00540 [bacterium ADurb.Bin429]
MTRQLVVAQRGSAAAILGNFRDERQRLCATCLENIVQRITGVPRRRQVSNGLPHRPMFGGNAVQIHRAVPCGHQDGAPSALRHPEIGGIPHGHADVSIAQPTQTANQCRHPAVIGETGHILHQHGLRAQGGHEAAELEDEVIAGIRDLPCAVQRAHGGKPLTRRTPGQEGQFPPLKVQLPHDALGIQAANITSPQANIPVIRAVCFGGKRIIVDGTNHVEARL